MSLHVQAAPTQTFTVSEDSFILASSPDAVKGGNYVEIKDIANGGARVAFLKFNVSGLGAATVASAKLKVNVRHVAAEDLLVPAIVDAKLLNGVDRNNWTESTLTYNNAPNLDDTTTLSSHPVTLAEYDEQWLSFDVSSAITGNGTYTIVFSIDTPVTSRVHFYTKEASSGSNAPQLELTLADAGLNTGIDVYPSHVIAVAGVSSPLQQQVTVVNNETVNVSNISVQNDSTPGFVISADTCSSATLAPDASCTFTVEASEAAPVSPEFGFINITSDSATTPSFQVFVSQTESEQQQAIRRIPAVVTDISVIDDLTSLAPTGTLEAGKSYTVNFSMQGYDDGYQTFAALFACATPDNTCAANASDILVWDKSSVQSSISNSDFWYKTASSQSYDYSINLTMPEYATAGYADTDAIVLRFYHRSQLDINLGSGSISAIVPGGQGLNMIGKLGRKIIIWQ